jgi:multiple sugar transport system permease protein
MIERRGPSDAAVLESGELAQEAPRAVAVRWGRTVRRVHVRTLALTLIAAGLALTWSLPLLWVASSSFKTQFEIVGPDPRWLPASPTLQNWANLMDPQGRAVNIVVAFTNSVVIALVSTLGTLLTSSMAAYAFARLRFPTQHLLFGVLLATLMIPNEVILVPLFLQFHRLGLLNTYAALVLPHAISVLGVYLLRQFMLGIPRDLEDAARIDGAGSWAVYRHVVLPLVRPALATLAIFAFLGSWNDFLWPLIVVSTPDKQTLPLALITFRSAYHAIDYGTVLASTVVAVGPPLIFFLFAQRFVIAGISRTGLKG